MTGSLVISFVQNDTKLWIKNAHSSHFSFWCLSLFRSAPRSLCMGSSVSLIQDTPVSNRKKLQLIRGVSVYGLLSVFMSHTGQVRVGTVRTWNLLAQSAHADASLTVYLVFYSSSSGSGVWYWCVANAASKLYLSCLFFKHIFIELKEVWHAGL